MYLTRFSMRKENCFMVKHLGLMVIFICSLSFTTWASDFSEASFPVVFKIDLKSPVPTALYIKCGVTNYNLTLDDFKAQKGGKRDKIAGEIIDGLRSNDFGKCKNRSWRNPKISEEDNDHLIKTLFDGYRSAFFNEEFAGKGFRYLRLRSQLHFGNKRIFILGNDLRPNLKSGPERIPLYFKDNKNGEFVWDMGPVPAGVSVLIESVQQIAISPKRFIKKNGLKLKYEMPIPSTTDRDIAYLQFNGSKYNFKVLSDLVDRYDKLNEVLELVQRKYSAAHKGERALIANLYTDLSRQKYLDWLETGDQVYLDWYFGDMGSKERTVRFIINADPLYVVFVEHEDRPNKLAIELIVRDPKDRKLKFTNYYFRGFVTQLLSDREFLSMFSDCIVTESGQSIEK